MLPRSTASGLCGPDGLEGGFDLLFFMILTFFKQAGDFIELPGFGSAMCFPLIGFRVCFAADCCVLVGCVGNHVHPFCCD